MAIKKGDNVIVIAGKDRGQKGKVLRVFTTANRVLVEGLNMRKKHRRPRKQNEKGQVVDMPVPMDVSNVQLYCTSCSKGVRTKAKMDGGKKLRVCVNCKKEI